MSHITSVQISLVFIIFVFQRHVSHAKTHFKYMTNHCSKTIEVNDSLLLALTSQENLSNDRDRDFVHCSLDLKAPKDMRLFAHFIQLGISPVIKHSDNVQLYDMRPKKKRLTPVKGLYGKLDRSLLLFDDSGAEVKDYKTNSRRMRIDYLGKPTVRSPGFRVLITAYRAPDSNGNCPSRHYYCTREYLCIPRQLACDGYSNCGKDDNRDEEGCDRDDTVTDLVAEYSLARDIVVVILLPVFIFIAIVIAIFLIARRYIRRKITKPEPPAVHYTPKKGGRVQIKDSLEMARLYAPPSYQDVIDPGVRFDPPPAYSSLADLVKAGEIEVVDTDDETNAANQRRQERRLKKEASNSTSSIEETGASGGKRPRQMTPEYEDYRLHCVWPSDTDDDEEMKQKRRKKGGKCKSKGKRRADGNDSSNLTPNHPNREFLHGISPLASPSSNSSHSVPYSDGAADSTTTASALTPDHSSSQNSPVHPFRKRIHNKSHSSAKTNGKSPNDGFIAIHEKPKTLPPPCVVETTAECHKSENSSGAEGDPKSETESRSASKRNSVTESNTSLGDQNSLKNEQIDIGKQSGSEESVASASSVKGDEADVSSESEDGAEISEIDKLKGKLPKQIARDATISNNGRLSVV